MSMGFYHLRNRALEDAGELLHDHFPTVLIYRAPTSAPCIAHLIDLACGYS